MKVPLLNFAGGPRIPLLTFEGGPGVLLLNFRGVTDPGSQNPGVLGPGILVPLLHHAGFTELCLLNLLILIVFLCNSYPCVLFESLSHVINQESHVLGKVYLVHFLKFWKIKLGKFIPNFPLEHVITSTNTFLLCHHKSL